MSRAALAAALAVAAAVPRLAAAHEVLHTIERGRAIAVRAYLPDGDGLAYSEYEVFAPSDPKVPHQKGRTDRRGWLAFVPDAPGAWRVKVVDATGHGLELTVDAGEISSARDDGAAGGWSYALRPLLGVAAIAAVFAALLALNRRKTGGAR